MATNGPAAAEATKVLRATVKVDAAAAKASRDTQAPLKRRVAKAHPEATLKAAKVKVQNQKVNLIPNRSAAIVAKQITLQKTASRPVELNIKAHTRAKLTCTQTRPTLINTSRMRPR